MMPAYKGQDMADLKLHDFGTAARPKAAPYIHVSIMHDVADMPGRGAPTGKYYVVSARQGERSVFTDCGHDSDKARAMANDLCHSPESRDLVVLSEAPYIAINPDAFDTIFHDWQAVIMCIKDSQFSIPAYFASDDDAAQAYERLQAKFATLKSNSQEAIRPALDVSHEGNIIRPAIFQRT